MYSRQPDMVLLQCVEHFFNKKQSREADRKLAYLRMLINYAKEREIPMYHICADKSSKAIDLGIKILHLAHHAELTLHNYHKFLQLNPEFKENLSRDEGIVVVGGSSLSRAEPYGGYFKRLLDSISNATYCSGHLNFAVALVEKYNKKNRIIIDPRATLFESTDSSFTLEDRLYEVLHIDINSSRRLTSRIKPTKKISY